MTEVVVRHCAPTLAGIKAGGMINCDRCAAESWMVAAEPALQRAGMAQALLWQRSERVLLFIYRPKQLSDDWVREGIEPFMSALGYDIADVEKCIARLQARFAEGCEFPHEVGLFLGYPLADVLGFMKCGGKDYKHNGYWKVYGDEANARRAFEKFSACTRNLLRRYQCGIGFEQLIAAGR